MRFGAFVFVLLNLVLLTLGACEEEPGPLDASAGMDASPDADASVVDASMADVDIYDPDHLLSVEITMPTESWDALRQETRGPETLAGDCLSGPFGSPFTWFEGEITIDGTRFARVDVRKKGFLGSLSTTRPSLKIDMAEFVDGQTYGGMRRLTFNNSREDPALVRQCLGYLLFERAGVPAPRCSFASVRVNGEDLGVYVNVEPINSAFVERVFGSDEGNLYEGTISDFRPEMVQTFDPKNNGEELGRSELEEFSEAILAEDDVLLEALAPFVDVDAFLSFWALESLIEHRDGYNGFRNNFYVYRDPATDQFCFIPWGVDLVFEGRGGVVYGRSALAHRLYQLPAIQDRYFERLQTILDDVWAEEALDEEITRMATLIEPGLGTRRQHVMDEIEVLRGHVASRRADIDARLEAGRPSIGIPAPFMCR